MTKLYKDKKGKYHYAIGNKKGQFAKKSDILKYLGYTDGVYKSKGKWFRVSGGFASKKEVKSKQKFIKIPDEPKGGAPPKFLDHYHVFKCEVSAFEIHHTMILETGNPNVAVKIHDDEYPDHKIIKQYYLGSK